jgi:type II secretory pathway component PulF
MPQFHYEAQSRDGRRVGGTVSAADAHAAAHALREEGLFPVRIVLVGAPRWGASVIHRLRPISPGGFAQFFTQLASLLRAGVNAHDALDELAALAGDRRLRRVSGEIAEQAAEGMSLAEQFARYPAIFPRHIVGFVAAGEELGALPEMLAELAAQYETQMRLQGRLLWLRVYYGAVLVLALLVAPFPWMIARGFGWYVHLFLTRLLPIIALAVLLIYALRAANAVPAIAALRSRLSLSIPLFGTLARWSALARFLCTLNFAQHAGVTMHHALDLAGEVTEHPGMRRAAERAATSIRHGAPLESALTQMRFLPLRIRQMLQGADRTGELERRLSAAADYAIERREASVNAISAGSAVGALVGSAVIVAIALYVAWSNFYDALFERAGV